MGPAFQSYTSLLPLLCPDCGGLHGEGEEGPAGAGQLRQAPSEANKVGLTCNNSGG
jgi:hypothetical protein